MGTWSFWDTDYGTSSCEIGKISCNFVHRNCSMCNFLYRLSIWTIGEDIRLWMMSSWYYIFNLDSRWYYSLWCCGQFCSFWSFISRAKHGYDFMYSFIASCVPSFPCNFLALYLILCYYFVSTHYVFVFSRGSLYFRCPHMWHVGTGICSSNPDNEISYVE